jgi:hypothetical protein
MLSARKIIEMYNQGMLTEMHTVGLLLENVTAEEFLELPEEWQTKVRGELNRLPRTEAGWAKMLFFGVSDQNETRKLWKERTDLLRQQLGIL